MLPSPDPLQELAEAWASRHPDRAAGGTTALAGFRFQLYVTLREIVRSVDTGGLARTVRTEVLSDLLDSDPDGPIIVSQLKLTGSSGALWKALDELWTIDQVAQEVAPDLLPRLTFEVRCSRWELQDTERSAARWAEKRTHDAAGFRSRLRFTTDPHPLLELVEMLTNRFRSADPLGWVDRQVGRLLDASSRAGAHAEEERKRDLAAVANALAEVLNAEERAPSGMLLLGPSFVPPETVETGRVLNNVQPIPRHLRDGFFAPREWIVGPATDAVGQWLASDPFVSDVARRVPMFWLGGRSGSGKSVALLQVASRLATSGVGPILWVGNRLARLREALAWAARAMERGSQPLLLLDDPYMPAEQDGALDRWREAIGQLDHHRDTGTRIPLLLACGPTEQGLLLQRELADDLDVTCTFQIDDQLDARHEPELRAWYRERTGQEAPTAGAGDLLMVQRFFEWRTGEPLDQFAKRFRRRVRAMRGGPEVEPIVGQLLAANQLYAGLPEGLLDTLSGAARDAMDLMEDEHHLAIDDSAGRPGLWLAHPHLAHALHAGWCPPDAHNERAELLRDACLTSLEHGQHPSERTAPLWAIARAADAPPEDPTHGRLEPRAVGRILTRVHRAVSQRGPLPLTQLPVWIRLSKALPGLRLEPSPVQRALDLLATEGIEAQRGARLCCHILLSTLADDELARAIRVIRGLVGRTQAWHEWPHVARHLLSVSGDLGDALIALAWVSRSPHSRHVPELLRTVLEDVPDARAPAVDTAAFFLRRDVHDPNSMFRIAETLLKLDELVDVVQSWAGRHAEAEKLPFVIQSLLRRGAPGARELGRRWLDANTESPVANYVLEPLLEEAPTAEDLDRAECWVRPDRRSAGRVIEHLIGHANDDRERVAIVAALGSQWLENHPGSADWPFVLQKLLDVVRDDAQRVLLIDTGVRWLEGRGDRVEWNYVLQKLLDVARDDTHRVRLIDTAVVWLGGREDRAEWSHVLRKLLNVVRDDAQRVRLIDTAVAWLGGREDRAEWAHVLQKLLDVVRDDAQRVRLIDTAIAWLEGREDRSEWAHVLQKLLDVVRDDAQRVLLIGTGVRWLEGREDRAEWKYVLQKLLDVVRDDAQRVRLLETATAWLDGRQKSCGWPFVAACVLEASPAPEVAVAAQQWLNEQGAVPPPGAKRLRQALRRA